MVRVKYLFLMPSATISSRPIVIYPSR